MYAYVPTRLAEASVVKAKAELDGALCTAEVDAHRRSELAVLGIRELNMSAVRRASSRIEEECYSGAEGKEVLSKPFVLFQPRESQHEYSSILIGPSLSSFSNYDRRAGGRSLECFMLFKRRASGLGRITILFSLLCRSSSSKTTASADGISAQARSEHFEEVGEILHVVSASRSERVFHVLVVIWVGNGRHTDAQLSETALLVLPLARTLCQYVGHRFCCRLHLESYGMISVEPHADVLIMIKLYDIKSAVRKVQNGIFTVGSNEFPNLTSQSS